ncbi:ABC transporter substrate-binding protein [Mangrovicoccus sp. HB161399]|uniref:ABC transporter substrate-binding protein n=1 Tax=Mangrovicoccus sp. HB161399 TaxID=2720392 RepID=UPI001555DE92|nr:ABC transporter substrate-binding protein [Mangrovicoccus sp. HB161399]
MKRTYIAPLALAAGMGAALPGFACETEVGMVMELTGPAGVYGQAGAKAIEMAFRDINEAGGVLGCEIVTDTRDSQSQGNVAVDQATQLVNIGHVPVVIGGIISSVSIPILTSVTGPGKVVQVSPASSSPTLTQLGADGKTGGYFFRTITSDALQGTAAAQYAIDQGMKKLAIIHVNNDFGVNMMREFSKTFEALGGEITSVTPYNERQANYSAEANAAMAGDPEALYLISYPVDGATIARAWISNGGPQKFLLNDGMNSEDFVTAVGAKYLGGAYGTSSGTAETASTAYFYDNFEAFSGGIAPDAPAADRSYDAGAIVALAIAQAGEADPAKIRDAIPQVTGTEGTPVHAGPEEFRKALDLIAAGEKIRYEGVIGPVAFDRYGDITGPFRLWKITDGAIETTGTMSAEQVGEIKAATSN